MQNQDLIKARRKSAAMRAIMKDPKLSQAIFDAWDAPIGSSKRVKAKNILESIGKASKIEDGQGGFLGDAYNATKGAAGWLGNLVKPTVSTAAKATGATLSTVSKAAGSAASKGKIVVKSVDNLLNGVANAATIPKLKAALPTGKVLSPFLKGLTKGGGLIAFPSPNNMSAYLAENDGWQRTRNALKVIPDYSVFKFKRGTNISPFNTTSKNGISDRAHPTQSATAPIKRFEQNITIHSGPEDSLTQPKSKKSGIYFTTDGVNVYKREFDEYNQPTGRGRLVTEEEARQNNIWADVIHMNEEGEPSNWTVEESNFYRNKGIANMRLAHLLTEGEGTDYSEDTFIEVARIEANGVSPDVDLVKRELRSSPATNLGFGVGPLANMTNEQRAAAWNSLNTSEKSLWKNSFDAVSAANQGVGSERYTQMVMGDKKMLGEFLGLTTAEAAALPESPLLSGQLKTLRLAIDSENHIDEQLDNIITLQNRGATIESDLQAYVRGKDEYLNEIDTLLTKTKLSMADMDLSDPAVKERMDNYINYLTTLEGRQSQRYIDFVATSIKQHEGELTQATNAFKISADRAAEMYNSEAAITSEQFNNIKASIKDSYDQVGIMQTKAAAIKKEKNDAMAQGYQMIQLAIQTKLMQNEYDNPTVKEKAPLSQANYDMWDKFAFDADKNGEIQFKTYDIDEVKNQVKRSGYTDPMDQATAAQRVLTQIKNSVSKEAAAGTISKLYEAKKPISDRIDKINEATQFRDKTMVENSSEWKQQTRAIEEIRNSIYPMQQNLIEATESGLNQYLTQTGKPEELRKALASLAQAGTDWRIDPIKVNEKNFVKKYKGTLTETYARALYNGVLAEVAKVKRGYSYKSTSGVDVPVAADPSYSARKYIPTMWDDPAGGRKMTSKAAELITKNLVL